MCVCVCVCVYTTPSLSSSPRAHLGKNPSSGDTQETQVQSLGWEVLEKEMATCSSMLAWEILWTEEPGGLQSMGLQRVGHNWVIKQQTAYHIFFIHSTVDRHIGCFHVLAIRDCASMITGVQVSFRIWLFVFSGYMPRSGTAGSCGNSIFSFLKEPPYRSPHPLQHLWTGDF